MTKIYAAALASDSAPSPIGDPTIPANENGGELGRRYGQLQEEVGELESVVTAAILVVTAFRLRDEDGLIGALRGLSDAVSALERTRDQQE